MIGQNTCDYGVVNALSFNGLLIIFALTIFAFVILLLWWLRRDSDQRPLMAKPRSRWLFGVYCSLAAVFVLFSAYSVLAGSRPLIWFLSFALLGALALYFANSSTGKHRTFSIALVILLAVLESSIPMIQNRGVIINSDQWRDLRVTTYIVDEGTFQNAPGLGTGYYSFIPLFNVLNAGISEIAGWPAMTTFTFLQFILPLIFALSIHAIVMRLTGQVQASIVAVMLFLSIPRLSDVQIVPSTVGISLGFLLILLLVKDSVGSLRNVVPVVAMLAFAINVFHPVGVIPVLALCLGTIVMSRLPFGRALSSQAISAAWRVFAICVLVTLTYWIADSRVFAGVFNPILRLVHIFTSVSQAHPSLYTPQYQGSGFEIFSFAWALPVAFSAAYAVWVLVHIRKDSWSSQDSSQHAITVAAFSGLLLILSAFSSMLISPGGGLEKYLNIPAYGLLLLPSAFVLGRFLSSRKKIPVLCAVLMLSAMVVIGSRSPDWAPFENPSFGAFRSTATSLVEANTLVTLVPNGTRLYEDYDIPLAEVAPLQHIEFTTDRNYDTTRKVVQMFEGNLFSPFDVDYRDAVIVMKADRIVNAEVSTVYVNIVYSSGRHIIVVGL